MAVLPSLSSTTAKWVDQLKMYGWRDENLLKWQNTARKIAVFVGIRFTAAVLFPFCNCLDMIHHTALYMGKWVVSKLTRNDPLLREASKHASFVRKCLRGLIASPFGWISPDIVTLHFLPLKKAEEVTPYGKLYSWNPDRRSAKTIEEVQNLVQEARKENKKVVIAGSQMSQGTQCVSQNDSLCIDMREIKHVQVDSQKKTAKIGAGATWNDIQKAVNEHQLAVQTMQASNVFSLGGSLSANCHGWDHRAGNIAQTVNFVTIVNAEGNIEILTPQDELFGYVIGGWGLFGVIVEAELQLTENTALKRHGLQICPKEFANRYEEEIGNNEAMHMHLYRLSLAPGKLLQEGMVECYSAIEEKRESLLSDLEEERSLGTLKDRILLHIGRRIGWARSFWWAEEKKQMVENTLDTERNVAMRYPVRAVFANRTKTDAEWLQEYYVDREDLAEFLEFASEVLNKNQVALLNATVRYVKADHISKFSYAARKERFALVLFFNQSLEPDEVEKTGNWVREMIDWLAQEKNGESRGTYYLAYQDFATTKQFRTCYPAWKEVVKKKHKIDPQELFSNGLYEKYFKREKV